MLSEKHDPPFWPLPSDRVTITRCCKIRQNIERSYGPEDNRVSGIFFFDSATGGKTHPTNIRSMVRGVLGCWPIRRGKWDRKKNEFPHQLHFLPHNFDYYGKDTVTEKDSKFSHCHCYAPARVKLGYSNVPLIFSVHHYFKHFFSIV